jgi:hypothetical protein
MTALPVRWPDATVEGVKLDYDEARIRVREDSGRTVEVVAGGYIGYEIVGFWDETIVESASLQTGSDFLSRCVAKVRERNGDPPRESGSPDRNSGSFQALEITLIDGAQIFCAAARFEILIL